MIKKQIKIINKLGLHARAAAKVIDCAQRYQSKIHLNFQRKSADAKSILDVMTLGATCGTHIEILADGPDEKNALNALCDLINRRFGEKE